MNHDINSSVYKYDPNYENKFTKQNTIVNQPKGWIIMDTWNNKLYPMDIFKVDTMKFNTSRLSDEFHAQYGGSRKDLFLPWHYTVDLVDEKPFITTNRPFTYKSGFPGYENYLTIMIIGDSNHDIYTSKIYKTIAHTVMNQFKYLGAFRISNEEDSIKYWTGKNFKKFELEKELI